MKPIKIGLIDDEEKTLEMLAAMISKTPGFEVAFASTTGSDGIEKSLSIQTDLVITDILMPEVNGIWIASRLKENNIPVIIISADWSQGWMGFEVQALDFIGKPISYYRLTVALDRFRKSMPQENYLPQPSKTIYIRDPKTASILPIPRKGIVFVKGAGDYMEIHFRDPGNKNVLRRQFARLTMAAIKDLVGDAFVKIHKSYLVNKNRVVKYEYDQITLDPDIKIPIGETYKSEMYNTFMYMTSG